MKNAVKNALICAAGIIILAVIGIFVLQKTVETVVEQQIQATANKLIGRNVYVQDVSYNIWSQKLEVSNLCIPNPQGYSDHPAIIVGKIGLDLKPMAAFKRLIHIKKLHVDGILFSVELQSNPLTFPDLLLLLAQKKVNFLDLKQKSLEYQNKANVPAQVKVNVPAVAKQSPKKKGTKAPVFIRIDELSITNTSASLQNYQFIPKGWRTFSVPDFNLKNIGADNKLTTDKLAVEIFKLTCKEIEKNTIGRAKETLIKKLEGIIKKTESFIQKSEAKLKEYESKSKSKWTKGLIEKLKKALDDAKKKLEEYKQKLESLQQDKETK